MTKGRDLDDKVLENISGAGDDVRKDKDEDSKPSGGGGGDQPFNAPATGDQVEP